MVFETFVSRDHFSFFFVVLGGWVPARDALYQVSIDTSTPSFTVQVESVNLQLQSFWNTFAVDTMAVDCAAGRLAITDPNVNPWHLTVITPVPSSLANTTYFLSNITYEQTSWFVYDDHLFQIEETHQQQNVISQWKAYDYSKNLVWTSQPLPQAAMQVYWPTAFVFGDACKATTKRNGSNNQRFVPV
jgi:hypothetical protein